MSESKYSHLIFEQVGNENPAHQTPKADGGIVTIPAIAAIAGAGLVYKIGSDWIPKLKSDSALIVQHLSSEPPTDKEERFCVTFSVENVSLHTIYLENIMVLRPDIGAEIAQIPESKISYRETESPPLLPWKILSHKNIMFSIKIEKNRLPLNVEQEPYGLLKLETSILHRKENNISNEIVFRIRGV